MKLRLEAVGLGPNHNKHLDIVGYELGGLIGRWFVEQVGGNKIANHLVLVGTPNAGTPWSTMQTWMTTALGIGLNSFSTVVWPVRMLGNCALALEAFDVTLDQMQPGSELLMTLETSPDPGIPYSIIQGNAGIKAGVLSQVVNGKSLLQRMMNKLAVGTANIAFLGQSNDLFASAYSLKKLDNSRKPQPKIVEVVCDHFTYFSSTAGVNAIAKALYTAASAAQQR